VIYNTVLLLVELMISCPFEGVSNSATLYRDSLPPVSGVLDSGTQCDSHTGKEKRSKAAV